VTLSLNSKTAHELFQNMNLQDRFRFIRDHLALAFRIENNLGEGNSPEEFVQHSMRSSQVRKTISGMHTVMTSDEKLEMRASIRQALC